jgi:hypothetical protein
MQTVSLIIPTWNRRAMLASAIDSALHQTYRNLEILVVDDGSTDDTAEYLVKQFGLPSAPAGSPLRWFTRPHQGIAATLNFAIRHATGHFIAALGDDDSLSPVALQTCVHFLENHPEIGLVYTDYMWSTDGTNWQRGKTHDFDLAALRQNNFIGWLVMYRAEMHQKVGMYDTTLPTHEDWDLWLRICHHAPAHHLEEPLYLWRTHSDRITLRPAMSRGRELVKERIRSGAYDKPQPRRRLHKAIWQSLTWLPTVPLQWVGALLGPSTGSHCFSLAKFPLDAAGTTTQTVLSPPMRLLARFIAAAGLKHWYIMRRLRGIHRPSSP